MCWVKISNSNTKECTDTIKNKEYIDLSNSNTKEYTGTIKNIRNMISVYVQMSPSVIRFGGADAF